MYISRYTYDIQWIHQFIGLVCLLLFSACAEDEFGRDESYVFQQPANFPDATYTFENNPVTKDGFLLGKKLFFDPIMSRDGSVSCGSCHQQGTAFADSQQHPFSRGVAERLGTRNAPSIANMAFISEFFWDGGVTHLDFVPINAIEAEFEMDETLANVVKKLNGNAAYRTLFKEAFDIDEITSPFMLHALSQFMLLMVSDDSKYDKYVRGEGETLTEEELKGMALFEEKCSVCHSGELFSDFSYRNNGLSASFTDLGRARITENSNEEGKFRVPSLRNVALTAPYMHNARFTTLDEVLNHYISGMVSSETIDPMFQNENGLGISMTQEEKEKIITFLHTLTDREFISDSRFFNSK